MTQKKKRKWKQHYLLHLHRLFTQFQLNTTDAPSTTVGGQGAVNWIFIWNQILNQIYFIEFKYLYIFIVVNKYLIDSIKKYLMFPFNWTN